MSSRDQILAKLNKAQRPFADMPPAPEPLPVQPIHDTSPAALRQRFINEAKKLNAQIWEPADEDAAIDQIIEILQSDQSLLAWDFSRVPLTKLADALARAGVKVAEPCAPDVRVGLTGVDAAFAATGSIVLSAGPQTPRTVSLLPYVHIAILREEQILPHFEAWIATQRAQDLEAFLKSSTTNIITGASRTADIGMELVLGAHGPAELHLMILNSSASSA